MFCTKCGAQNSDDSKFCGKCGAAFDGAVPGGQPFVQPKPAQQPVTSNKSVATLSSPLMGLMLGLASLFLSVCTLVLVGETNTESGRGAFFFLAFCLLTAGIVYFATRTRQNEKTGGAKIARIIITVGTVPGIVIGILMIAIEGNFEYFLTFSLLSLPLLFFSILHAIALKIHKYVK